MKAGKQGQILGREVMGATKVSKEDSDVVRATLELTRVACRKRVFGEPSKLWRTIEFPESPAKTGAPVDWWGAPAEWQERDH